jgi:ATP-dependent Clp protease adaptor protein ClpS
MLPDSTIPNPLIPAEIEQPVAEPVRTENSNLWKIIVHNDEVTPYDFVIQILGDLFMLSEELADHVAWTAHTKGVAVVGVRPRAEAEKLVKVAHGRARWVSYPLTFSLEQN